MELEPWLPPDQGSGVNIPSSLPTSIIHLYPFPPPPPPQALPTLPPPPLLEKGWLTFVGRAWELETWFYGYMAHYHCVTLLPHLVALCPPVTPVLERRRQADLPRVQGHAGQPDYIARPCLKATQKPSLLCNSRKELIPQILMGCCLSGALGFGVCKHNLTWK